MNLTEPIHPQTDALNSFSPNTSIVPLTMLGVRSLRTPDSSQSRHFGNVTCSCPSASLCLLVSSCSTALVPPVESLYVAAARPPVPVPPATSLSQPQRPTNLSSDNEPFPLSSYDGTTLGVSVSTLSQAVIPEDPFFNT